MSLEPLSVSTSEIAERDRDEVMREYYGKIAMRMEVEPADPGDFSIDARSFLLPGITLTNGLVTSMTAERTAAMRADGNADVILMFPEHGMLLGERGREDVMIRPGDALLTSLDRPVSFFTPKKRNEQISLQIPREALAPLVSNLDDRLAGTLPVAMPGVNLLKQYAVSLMGSALPPGQLRDLAARHLVELTALAIGVDREVGEQVDGGIRGARLAAAKKVVMENIDDPDLSVSFVATRLGISPRYLHILFDTEGFTLSAFVTQQRLRRALRILNDPSQHRRKIIDIAFDAGFNDLRTFNRAFRKCYDKTPTEARFEALRANAD